MLREKLIADLILIVLFLFINPIYALIIVTLLSFRFEFSFLPFLIMGTLSFSLFYFNREYGVIWYDKGSDDVPVYIQMFFNDKGISFVELFERFFDFPALNEPLWHLIPWSMINIFHTSSMSFVFFHYLILFGTVFIALRMIAEKQYLLLNSLYFFLTPLTFYTMIHIFRQQLAFTVFLLGVTLVLKQKKELSGYLLLLATPLIHTSSLLFIGLLGIFALIKRFFSNHYSLASLVFIIILGLLYSLILEYAGLVGFEQQVQDYTDKSAAVSGLGYFVFNVFPYLFVFFVAERYLKIDDFAKTLLFFFLFTLFLPLLLGKSDIIIYRLFQYATPFFSIYAFYVLKDIKAVYRISLFVLIIIQFFYFLYKIKGGVLQVTANGHYLDPFYGILTLILF